MEDAQIDNADLEAYWEQTGREMLEDKAQPNVFGSEQTIVDITQTEKGLIGRLLAKISRDPVAQRRRSIYREKGFPIAAMELEKRNFLSGTSGAAVVESVSVSVDSAPAPQFTEAQATALAEAIIAGQDAEQAPVAPEVPEVQMVAALQENGGHEDSETHEPHIEAKLNPENDHIVDLHIENLSDGTVLLQDEQHHILGSKHVAAEVHVEIPKEHGKYVLEVLDGHNEIVATIDVEVDVEGVHLGEVEMHEGEHGHEAEHEHEHHHAHEAHGEHEAHEPHYEHGHLHEEHAHSHDHAEHEHEHAHSHDHAHEEHEEHDDEHDEDAAMAETFPGEFDDLLEDEHDHHKSDAHEEKLADSSSDDAVVAEVPKEVHPSDLPKGEAEVTEIKAYRLGTPYKPQNDDALSHDEQIIILDSAGRAEPGARASWGIVAGVTALGAAFKRRRQKNVRA